jgi:prepilin-type N-terminal cleavage/methylation domain-containing protein
MKRLRLEFSQSGFTLIELMIVVGIIGILVAIAAPNFSKYQSKARQSESKIALAAVYGGEKAFYSEYSAYIGDMDAIGYAPEGQKRFYTVGWNAAGGAVTGYPTAAANGLYSRTNFPAAWTTCADADTAVSTTMAGTDNQSFTVGARGQIRDGVNCDQWTIDNTKILSNSTINL